MLLQGICLRQVCLVLYATWLHDSCCWMALPHDGLCAAATPPLHCCRGEGQVRGC